MRRQDERRYQDTKRIDISTPKSIRNRTDKSRCSTCSCFWIISSWCDKVLPYACRVLSTSSFCRSTVSLNCRTRWVCDSSPVARQSTKHKLARQAASTYWRPARLVTVVQWPLLGCRLDAAPQSKLPDLRECLSARSFSMQDKQRSRPWQEHSLVTAFVIAMHCNSWERSWASAVGRWSAEHRENRTNKASNLVNLHLLGALLNDIQQHVA